MPTLIAPLCFSLKGGNGSRTGNRHERRANSIRDFESARANFRVVWCDPPTTTNWNGQRDGSTADFSQASGVGMSDEITKCSKTTEGRTLDASELKDPFAVGHHCNRSQRALSSVPSDKMKCAGRARMISRPAMAWFGSSLVLGP
jgi:hypothetical protein